MTSLQRDPNEAKEMLRAMDSNNDDTITFEGFIAMMQQIESKMSRADPEHLKRKEF